VEVPETMLTLKGSLYLFVRTGKCTLDPKSVSVLYTYYVCLFFAGSRFEGVWGVCINLEN